MVSKAERTCPGEPARSSISFVPPPPESAHAGHQPDVGFCGLNPMGMEANLGAAAQCRAAGAATIGARLPLAIVAF
jgi:hypothetical protein